MIFGGAGVTHSSPNMKLHHVDGQSLMWSSILQAPHQSRGIKASDQSLGSSFGCSFGSFNVNDSNHGNIWYILHLEFMIISVYLRYVWIFTNASSWNSSSSANTGSIRQWILFLWQSKQCSGKNSYFHDFLCNFFQNSLNSSFVTVDSESDLGGECSVARTGHVSRRLSSNADMPDFGSWCSLKRRVMSMVDSSLSPMTRFNSQPNMVVMAQTGTSPGIKSASLCQNENLR